MKLFSLQVRVARDATKATDILTTSQIWSGRRIWQQAKPGWSEILSVLMNLVICFIPVLSQSSALTEVNRENINISIWWPYYHSPTSWYCVKFKPWHACICCFMVIHFIYICYHSTSQIQISWDHLVQFLPWSPPLVINLQLGNGLVEANVNQLLFRNSGRFLLIFWISKELIQLFWKECIWIDNSNLKIRCQIPSFMLNWSYWIWKVIPVKTEHQLVWHPIFKYPEYLDKQEISKIVKCFQGWVFHNFNNSHSI